MTFDDDENPRIQKVREICKSLMPAEYFVVDDSSSEVDTASPDSWFIVPCRADYKRSTFAELNHFLPAWHRDQIPTDWQRCHMKLQEDLERKQKVFANRVAKLRREPKSADTTSAIAELEELMERLDAEEKLHQTVRERGLFAEDVLADGNCGIYSLDELGQGKPARMRGGKSYSRKRAHQLRKETRLYKTLEIGDMWMEVSAHPAWQTMFKFFGMKDFVEEEIERVRTEQAKDGDEPQKSQTPKSGTPKKKKQKPVPQNTPEKPPMPAEMTKSSCRAADFGKPIKVEAGLKPPQKKTKSAKRKVVQEEDDLLEQLAEVEPADEAKEDDEQEEGATVPRMKRARHARTCKKKLVTNRVQQLGVVKQYLGRIGASYPEFQSTHTRKASLKKTAVCPVGGYVSLQQHLLLGNAEAATSKCHACQELLKRCRFSAERLQQELDDPTGELATTSKPEDQNAAREVCEEPPEVKEEIDPDAKEDQDSDPFAYAKKFPGVIELLPPGSLGKTFPFKCLVCKSKTQPQGKVGELSLAKHYSVKYFIDKHLGCVTHKRNLASLSQTAQEAGAASMEDEERTVPCSGLVLNNEENAGHLFSLQKEFGLWVSMTNLSQLAVHKYEQDKSAHGVPRTVLKFAKKYYMARLLSSRLFAGQQAAKAVESEIQQSALYEHDFKVVSKLLKMSNSQLQQFVRASWLSATRETATEAHADFVTSIVKPCLKVNVMGIPEEMSDIVGRFTAIIRSGRAQEQDLASFKIAAAAMQGKLESHPLLHGISLQSKTGFSLLQPEIGRFVLCFDATYLTPTLSQLKIHSQHGLVGGMFKTGAEGSCFISLEEEKLNISSVVKALNMLEMIAWDPCQKRKNPLSICSLPIEHNFSNVQGTNRSNWFMLDLLGRVLEKASGIVRALVFDQHSSQLFIRKVIHGQLQGMDPIELRALPWFGKLSYESLPACCLPRLPVRLCKEPVSGEYFWALPGVCHSSKNLNGQMVSPLRTLFFGELFTDNTQCRVHGLPPAAYSRVNPQSDKLNSLVNNPFFLVDSVEGSLEAMTIPWSLSGLCIHNCMTALCLSGLVHRDLTMAERCENAVSGFVGMDLFKILADRKCKAMELPAGSCFYAGQTLSNAQSAALATMVVTLTKPPWYNCFDHGNGRLTEISVEQWFAGIRQQSSNSQVSARSYFLACARQNLRAGEILNKLKATPARQEAALTDSEWLVCTLPVCSSHGDGPYMSLCFCRGIGNSLAFCRACLLPVSKVPDLL
ncbi:Uncharacterized protein SCF082_LOCUS2894 [Durusdinium trenchii]|uniref:Uncharacterized protein n=1 Tax=Durusdinium trenchii TaxID=1381693 RepID=A0ABP0HPR2_9DINO